MQMQDIPTRHAETTTIDEIMAAVYGGQISLFFQPKVELSTGVTRGVEALVRWQHPRRGWISPEHFLPVVENSQQVDEFTLWVLETAIGQFRQWQAQAGMSLPIAINVSARNVESPRWVDEASRTLRAAGLAPGSIELEITETRLIGDFERAYERIAALMAAGFSIAIDDFGTGYSSFGYLLKLPINVLKLDRSLISGLPCSERKQVLVASLAGMAVSLGHTVVAEGIEDLLTEETVRMLGCQVGQGYHFAKPMAGDELVGWVAERQRLDLPPRHPRALDRATVVDCQPLAGPLQSSRELFDEFMAGRVF